MTEGLEPALFGRGQFPAAPREILVDDVAIVVEFASDEVLEHVAHDHGERMVIKRCEERLGLDAERGASRADMHFENLAEGLAPIRTLRPFPQPGDRLVRRGKPR